MKRIITVSDPPDFYEFLIMEYSDRAVVLKVTKHTGDSQFPRELSYDSLPQKIKNRFIEEINGN